MKKKEWVIIVLLVFFGLVYQTIEKGKIKFSNDFSFYSNERRLKGNQFVEFPEKEKVFQSVNKVSVVNPAGEIVVSRSGDGQVHLSSFYRIYYSDKKEIDEIRKKIALETDLTDDLLKVSSQYVSTFPYQQARIHFHLSVPETVFLEIVNHEGNTIIHDTGKSIHIDQENGNLFLENISSDLQLQLKNCNANIKNIAEHVEIEASRSNIVLENAGSLTIRGKHGDYSLKGIKSDVFVEHSYGKLELDDAGKLEVSARYSDIVARNIKNGAIITNKYENILLENINGNIRISSRLCKIDLRNISGKNTSIENSFADINILDYSGENLDVLLKNGNLNLQVKNVLNRINVKSKNAGIYLTFGVLSDPTFSIKTKHGQIFAESSLDLEKYEENDESFTNRTGQKPEILIDNIYGDVHLKTLN
jgi:hypothetical protein